MLEQLPGSRDCLGWLPKLPVKSGPHGLEAVRKCVVGLVKRRGKAFKPPESRAPTELIDVVGQGEQILRRAGDGALGLVIDLEYFHAEVFPEVAADYPDTD